MIKNKALSKKVLTSLLAMSCVYLGGTFSPGICTAAFLEGKPVNGNSTYSFADGYVIHMQVNPDAGTPIYVENSSENMTIHAEGNLGIRGGSTNGAVQVIDGILNFTGGNITLTVPGSGGATVSGLLANGGTINFKNTGTAIISDSSNEYGVNNYVVTVQKGGTINFEHAAVIQGSATKTMVIGMYATGGNLSAKDNIYINVSGGTSARGLQIANGTGTFEKDLMITAQDSTTGDYGIFVSTGGALTTNGKLDVDVTGNMAKNALQVSGGTANINGAAELDRVTNIDGFTIASVNNAVINFAGDVVINRDNMNSTHLQNAAIAATSGGTVNINQAGGNAVLIKGGLNINGGKLNLKLDSADDLLEGFISTANGGMSVFDMSNGAVWRVSHVAAVGDSFLSKLTLQSNATVDMSLDENNGTKLNIGEYAGDGGNFILDTDLASETDGDKVSITNSAAGTTYVQVKDISLKNGQMVTGNKNLLIVTDASENATFVGKSLNAGGLWDVTPTIENGLAVTDADGNVIGTADQWYLTKIAKAVNNDTGVLLDAADNSYALWRNTNDSLRERLGELRYRSNKTDGDGIWARYKGGKFSGSNFDSSYNMYQLGYDKADNTKSTYGFAIDSGTGHANYAAGGGKDKLMALSLYGTWTGDKGNYTDVVARVGQFDTDVDSYGDFPDKASYKNRAYSLSVEYGKTFELSKERGTFIEPQAQLIMGRLGSSSYTTDRGTAVAVEGMNSAIVRLGVVAGKKINDGSDIYFKASALHEFAGERDISMRAANGEVLAGSNDYGDTWFELGFGGNVKLGRASHLYGDIERSFGADIQKKWQVNAGVRFEF